MFTTEQWNIGKKIIESLKQHGHEAVFVGGAVRDYVCQKPANDVDIATSALPEEVKRVFKRTADLGLAHGTVLVIEDGIPIEVTTFRTEGEYEDHRRPADVKFVRSLEEDLKRRDFTMNALAMTEDFNIIDLFDGQTDLNNGLIRTVGNPMERFKEDALRMLRGVRFTAQHGFSIESSTFVAIKACATDLSYVSVERVTAELEKIWLGKFLYKGIDNLIKSGLSEQLPGDFPFSDPKWKDLGNPRNVLVCWAFLCLLQDRPTVMELARLYRLSNDAQRQIGQLVAATLIRCERSYTIVDLYQFDEEILILAQSLANSLGECREPMPTEVLSELKKSLPIQSSRELKVTGRELIRWFDKPGGPWLKETLTKIEFAVLHHKVENNAEKIKEWLMNESNCEV